MAFFNKRMILLFTNLFLLAGIGTTIANYSTSVIQGEAITEKVVSIDTIDFGNPTLTSTYSTFTNQQACGFSFSVRTNRSTTPADPSNGFRVNNNTIFTGSSAAYILFDFGTKKLVGFTGTFYSSSTSNRYIRIASAAGTNPTEPTYTNYTLVKSSISNVIEYTYVTTNVEIPQLTGGVYISASGSLGITEISFYYID